MLHDRNIHSLEIIKCKPINLSIQMCSKIIITTKAMQRLTVLVVEIFLPKGFALSRYLGMNVTN